MQQLRKWGNWTKTTAHRKLAGESVAPIEEVLLEGVLNHYSNEAACQQEISFDFDLQKGVIVSAPVFCGSHK